MKVQKFTPDCFCPVIPEDLVIKETRDSVTEQLKQAQFYRHEALLLFYFNTYYVD